MAKIHEIYYDMTPREIAKMCGKSLQTVTVGVSRMVKEHPEWKIKEGRSVTIKADGVEWLMNTYFRMDQYQLGLLDEERERLQRKIDALEDQLFEKEQYTKDLSKKLDLAIEKQAEINKQYRLENDRKAAEIQQLELKTRQYESDIKIKDEQIKEVEDALYLKDKELQTSYEELNKFKMKKFFGIEYYIKEK